MKRMLSIVLVSITVFFMYGCGGTNDTDILPALEIVGDTVMEVEQYSTFVDPGVGILGDFDLEVVVESDVDTSMVGEYTITYSITYEEVVYDATRTVKVVELGTAITPGLQLVGDAIIEVEKDSVFVDPGVGLIGGLNLDIVTTGTVDTSTLGDYTIVYIITYMEVDYTVTRTVKVIENTSVNPVVITLNGQSNIEIEKYTTFVDLGVDVISPITLVVEIDSDLDISLIGTYNITYTVTYNEIEYTVSRVVTVVDSTLTMDPNIELVGDDYMRIEQYTTFVDPGSVVVGNVTLAVTVDSDVDASMVGIYTITYTIMYMEIEYSVVRTVEVVALGTIDDPALRLIGESYFTVEQSTAFVDPGAILIGDFTLDIVVTGTVDTNTVGIYIITYSILYMEIEYSVTRTVDVYAEGTILTPGMTLVGESLMEVEQNTLFIDPGVTFERDLGLDVIVVSNVDMNVEGTYTIMYTVTYNDIQYLVTRTVEVVFELVVVIPDVFEITIVEDTVSGSTISVVVTVTDDDNVIGSRFVTIYKDNIIVDSKPFVNGVNNISFTGLEENTLYKVKVTGSYLDNGNTAMLNGYELEVTTLEVGELSFSIGDLGVTTSVIGFGLEIVDEDSVLTDLVAYLYNGETLIETLPLFDTIEYYDDGDYIGAFTWVEFDELDELTLYTIQIRYNYMPLGTSLEVENVLVEGEFDYTTLESVMPGIITNTCNERYYVLECDLDIDETGFEWFNIYAKLYKDDVYVKQVYIGTSDGAYTFEFLDINTEYRIDIYSDFTQTSTQGSFNGVVIDSIIVSTLESGHAAPIISNVVITTTSDNVTVDFDLTDAEHSIDKGYTYLYNGISSMGRVEVVEGHNTVVFEEYIDENTLYTVKINIDYTGNSNFTTLYEGTAFVPPVITINSFEQKEMFFGGDHLIMKVNLNNDEEYDIDAVTINGVRYSTLLFPTNSQTLYVDMGVQEVGTYTFNLENIIISNNEIDYIISLTSERSVEIYLSGTIEPDDATVEVIDIIPVENYVIVSRANADAMTTLIVDVYLENKYELPITSLTIGGYTYTGTELTIVTPTHIQLEASISYNTRSRASFSYGEIAFERNGESATNVLGIHTYVTARAIYDFDNNSSTVDVIHISTATELMSIDSGSAHNKAYVLDNDIDMSGVVFSPIGTYSNPFSGSFDGQGFTISNLTIDMTFNETVYSLDYVGLFGYSTGFISNLHIDNMNVTVNSNEILLLHIGTVAGKSTGKIYDVHVTNSSINVFGIIFGEIGGLVGFAESDLVRTSAETDITIVTATFGETSHILNVGGLVGTQLYKDVRNSIASGDIYVAIISAQTVHVGGLIGDTPNPQRDTMISNSYATGNIDTTGDTYSLVGGLIGDAGFAIIDNSFATGYVHSASGKMGGLVGFNDGFISSSFATGTVTGDHGTVGKVAGFANHYAYELMFTYDGQLSYVGGSTTPTNGIDFYYSELGVASSIQFNDAAYYTDFLGWNSHFFDFSNLNIVSGNLPVFLTE